MIDVNVNVGDIEKQPIFARLNRAADSSVNRLVCYWTTRGDVVKTKLAPPTFIGIWLMPARRSATRMSQPPVARQYL